MPRWIPEAVWKGCDVFVIGGGDSLRTFDWSVLKQENTIGCNNAFELGSLICKLCVFGDFRWWQKFKPDLEKYQGVVFTNSPQLVNSRIPWLWTMGRLARGLPLTQLGWNKNTGALALHLALLLGAARVFLLGFDMKLSPEQRANWHDSSMKPPDASHYPKFLEAFISVKKSLDLHWSKVEVVNITDDSDLEAFPKIGVKEFFGKRRRENVRA